ncbi:ferrochelatase [Haloterrigena alkaliphila]|uniref:Ferrochelatase n=1 Tax=Haloterrigena alkaliphila TaxID=2816475 RepID=A0A8A2VS53_9EURY|nr:ferrochelatase [Haloterrigena alkaliphila]QSX00869.1 ferrochelatase [Haloterrigena alkaliphila]
MSTGVALLNFGEPERPTRETVVDYLERIFYANADIEGETTEAEARERSRQLAQRRAPALIEEYEEIGGSPLQSHADAQATLLERELRDRGYDVTTYVGMQFTEPFIEDAVERARSDGVEQLVGLPIYPLCGPSTTVAALEELTDAIEAAEWDVDVSELTGWHRHPGYTRARADNVRSFVETQGLSLEGDARLVFSAHGTPQYYLDEGSRYVEYVEEYCEALAAQLGVDEYELGYQNHENRDVDWTEPSIERVIETVDADRVVVEPVSFVHEQSETLSELDVELREEALEAGLDFYRVPVPYDDEQFIDALADLIEPFTGGFEPGYYNLRQCQCRDAPGAFCLNSPRTR